MTLTPFDREELARMAKDLAQRGYVGLAYEIETLTICIVQGQVKPITKQSTTLYASDRDMWVFLADEHNRIELPNRRNGKTGSLLEREAGKILKLAA